MNVQTVPSLSAVDQYIIGQLDQSRKLRRTWMGISMLIMTSVAVFIALQ